MWFSITCFKKKLTYANKFPTKAEEPGSLIWRAMSSDRRKEDSCKGLGSSPPEKHWAKEQYSVNGEMPGDPKARSAQVLPTS